MRFRFRPELTAFAGALALRMSFQFARRGLWVQSQGDWIQRVGWFDRDGWSFWATAEQWWVLGAIFTVFGRTFFTHDEVDAFF